MHVILILVVSHKHTKCRQGPQFSALFASFHPLQDFCQRAALLAHCYTAEVLGATLAAFL